MLEWLRWTVTTEVRPLLHRRMKSAIPANWKYVVLLTDFAPADWPLLSVGATSVSQEGKSSFRLEVTTMLRNRIGSCTFYPGEASYRWKFTYYVYINDPPPITAQTIDETVQFFCYCMEDAEHPYIPTVEGQRRVVYYGFIDFAVKTYKHQCVKHFRPTASCNVERPTPKTSNEGRDRLIAYYTTRTNRSIGEPAFYFASC